tara:strand:+ start:315 stop:851 length:537 start_codon:yes stop_codon:yes gene_type:complete
MKKICIFIFLLIFSSQSYAYDCSFDKIKPGVTSKSLEEINIFAYGSNSSSEPYVRMIQAQDICKNDYKDGDELRNIMSLNINLVFAEDKLIKVNYINDLSESTILFDILTNDYKINFKRNEQEIEKKRSEFYNTTLNNNSYFYVLLKNKDRQQEYLEITSDKHIEKLEKHLLKIEETQ